MQRGKGRVWILPGSKATSTVEVTLSLQRGTGVLQVEKSGKGILAMFIYCRGANRVGKVTNSGVDWDTVIKQILSLHSSGWEVEIRESWSLGQRKQLDPVAQPEQSPPEAHRYRPGQGSRPRGCGSHRPRELSPKCT